MGRDQPRICGRQLCLDVVGVRDGLGQTGLHGLPLPPCGRVALPRRPAFGLRAQRHAALNSAVESRGARRGAYLGGQRLGQCAELLEIEVDASLRLGILSPGARQLRLGSVRRRPLRPQLRLQPRHERLELRPNVGSGSAGGQHLAWVWMAAGRRQRTWGRKGAVVVVFEAPEGFRLGVLCPAPDKSFASSSQFPCHVSAAARGRSSAMARS